MTGLASQFVEESGLITAISLFVLLLIFIIVFKFNKKANPKPSKTTHNTFIEIAWTVVPVLILVIMAVPSFKLLYKGDVVPEAHMTIKAIGHQWYWTYEYTDHGNFTYYATMFTDEDFKDEDYNNKIKNEDVSVIQFSAPWCGPCNSLKPVMDKLAVQ